MVVKTLRVHGSCVEFAGAAVLLRGPSGAGKSDLALRLIDGPNGGMGNCGPARLVADDQVCLERQGDRIVARAPAATAGKLEIRGLGIVEMDATAQARLVLVVDLVDHREIARMPEAGALRMTLLGVTVVRIAVDPASASAPARIRAALSHFGVARGPSDY